MTNGNTQNINACSALKVLVIALNAVAVVNVLKLTVNKLEQQEQKRHWHRCFPVNFAKFLRIPFFTEHLQWMLLHII